MTQENGRRWRLIFIIGLLLIATAILIWRLVYLSVIERHFLQQQSDMRALRTINIPAYRGMITDRNGNPLAISTPVDSVWMNPQMFHATVQQKIQLANLLQLSVRDINAKLKRNSKRQFAYLKRRVNPPISKKIKALEITGIFFQREYRRYYPEGAVTAHVLGFTNIDDQGQEGLELAFNKWLRGIPGRERVVKDRLGQTIAVVNVLRESRQGHDLVLSLDSRIQYLSFRVLKATVKKYDAASGSVVVLDPKTGEILAMVNMPSYNPNDPPKVEDGSYRNRAVTDVFEPGSTMKSFSMVSALESGKYTPNMLINTNPGWLMMDGYKITDDGLNHGIITVTQVLQKSSNVGMAKMTLSLPPMHLWHVLRRLGFGQRTRSGFPGEVNGSLLEHKIWRPVDLATLSFGYGISVTVLQLAHAYAVLADHGIKVPVTFLKRNKIPQGQQEVSRKVADEMLLMLETVLEPGGTAMRARVPDYFVAGKTGTAYIAGPHGYEKNHYMASFVGIAPVTNPRLVVAVVIRNPRRIAHFGGLVAAPAFAKIMGGALRFLNVTPDDLQHAQK